VEESKDIGRLLKNNLMEKRIWIILFSVGLLILTIFLLGCNRSDVDKSIIKNMQLAVVDDLQLFEVSILVKDTDGIPLKDANVRLYNRENSIFFPINSRLENSGGKSCDRVFFDDNYYSKTDSNGIAKVKITKGNYLIQVGKEINPNSDNKEVIYLEKEIFLQNSQQIEISAKNKIPISAVANSINIENFEFWITNYEKKRGFSPFSFGWAKEGFILQTNEDSHPYLLIAKRPDENSNGYFILEVINPANNLQIQRDSSELAELTFNSYNGNNQQEDIGIVHLNFIDFYINNFGVDFKSRKDTKVFIDPQIVFIWYGLEKESQYFGFLKESGSIVELSKGDKKIFNFGGFFNLNLKIASFNPPKMAFSNYIWFIVKDSYGNMLKDYRTINPSSPKVVIKKDPEIVFDQPLENNYPGIHTDVRNNYYFENPKDYKVTFSEDFHEFGSINLLDVPMDKLEMNLVNFESQNLDFIMPEELLFLKDDWVTNFEKFYNKMYGLYGVRTSEKVPFRVIVDGADRAWAPIIWPMVAYECDTRNYQCWFMIVHEIGHPFTINAPLNCLSENNCPYNEESKASYSGITSAQQINKVIGENLKSKYPIVFKRLENQNVCYDKIEVIQTLMLYLDKRYPDKKPSVVLIKEWKSKYNKLYNQLIKKGFNHDESYGALYSYIVQENIGSIFEKFGLASQQRISDALKKL
jgi:hypothetical protein